MLPDSAWSSPFNKSELKFSSVGSDWKSFMNECLMGTEIFKKNENENEKCLPVDPNFVMDVRHRMVKQSTKIIPLPQVLIHAEALNLLRVENQNRLLRQKEGKIVEKEIEKLKQVLENHRLFMNQKINETTSKKLKYLSNMQKFPKYKKSWKKLDSHNDVDTWKCQSVQIKMESKLSQNTTPDDFKVSSKLEEHIDEFSEPISNQKGSIIENENECENHFWEIHEGKNEIMKRFLEKKGVEVKQELQCDEKESEKIKETLKTEDLVKQKRIEHAWNIWKTYTQKRKSRKREKVIYKNKIETFLMKLKEKEKCKQHGDIMSIKAGIKANSILKKKTENREKQMNVEKKDERLEKLMKEIKMSQTETYQKLKEIKRNSLGNQANFANTEFLKRMEERRTERLKRRKEIEEKKRMIEEEREKAQREKEEEKKRQEEEYKRKNVEAFKEKRRLEKERKEEQQKLREKLRLNKRLADSHYEKHLLRSYGLRPWKALLKIRNSQNQLALGFFETRLKQKVFHKWASNAREQMTFRFKTADAFYEKVLKRNCLFIWVLFHKEKMKQNQVAVDWNDFKIMERAFRRWLHFTQNECLDYLNKKYAAELNYQRKLKMKCLIKLRHYPDLKKVEQARENRKRKWRQKVKEILPDYRPVDITENY